MLPGVAWALPPAPTVAVDPAAHAQADELFKAGRAAVLAGDNKTACDKFGQSEKLEPAPGTQLNLGACEAAQGHILAAREHFRLAVAGFKPDHKSRPFAAAQLVELSKRLGHLTVHSAPGLAPEARIAVDGATLDATTLQQGIEVDPGKIHVVVTAAGRQPRSYDVAVGAGETKDLIAEAGDPLAPGATTTATKPAPPVGGESTKNSTRDLMHTLGFVGAGAGAAGLLTGTIFGALALHEASVVKANCNASFACQPPGVTAGSRGKTYSVVSTTGFIAGGVLAAAGVYLLVTTWGNPRAATGPAPASGALILTPTLDPSGGGFTAAWTF